MKNEHTPAQHEYEATVDSLREFCDSYTDLTVNIIDTEYPFRVQFIPDAQLNMFENENIDENGEFNDLTVTVGLTTSVKSTLKFKMESKLLKKLIKLAEQVGRLYYHAFREGAGDLGQDDELRGMLKDVLENTSDTVPHNEDGEETEE